MHISIKTSEGKRIKLEVEDSSNTIDLKIHGNGQPISELVLRLGPGPGPGQDREVMKIYVETLSGKLLTFQVNESVTIGEVKAKYAKMEGTPSSKQRIYFQGKQLEDSRTIADCDIKHESILVLMLEQCGC
ncbi:unnamed protein product [Microthlaspi erraticum]|uniref:Ubiquitin-like domain-containing protein n=1 Tax=Microthlaspi erraticum TaxID=1685480 RepID=A0A6D2HZV4_9BRAS|nr:unnamed protein product [Microthlaspi erraticum]